MGSRITVGALLLVAMALAVLAISGAASAAADLRVTNADVSISVQSPTQNNIVVLTVTVANNGDTNATSFTVGFYLDSTATQIATVAASSVPAGATTNFSASWNVGATGAGTHSLIAWADSASVVVESSDGNNQGTISFDVNVAPTASATVNTTSHQTFEPFLFDASGSTDSDGTITSYLWVFDDGTTATGDTVLHSYSDGGAGAGKVYTVTVVVTDDDGGIDTFQRVVNVINRVPTANAANVGGLTKTPLLFDGASSFDPDGRIVNATWSFSDGVTRYGLTILRSFDDDGSYSVTLTVRDDDTATDATSSLSITITNQAAVPVVTTSPVMPLQANVTSVFEGRNSYDVDGGITNYTWLFPGGVTVFGWNATHMFTQNGSYNVTLVLVDDDGFVSQLTIVAIVGAAAGGPQVPTPPVARISASALTVYTGDPIIFDGSNSTDDTGIVSFVWDFGDSTTAIGLLVSHSWSANGNFDVKLNVTDNDGNSTIAVVGVRVLNRLPVAAISFSPGTSQTLSDVSFDASSSVDPDGSLIQYRWDFGDGTAAFGSTVARGYARPAVYSVMLTVTDNDGGEGRTSVLITITNRAPVAVVPAPFSVPTWQDQLFSGAASYDSDGVIQSYSWDFGDGGTATGLSAKHQFTSQGAKTVTLTVRDDFGASSSAAFTVTVTNNAPTVQIQGPLTVYTGAPAAFTGVAVDLDGSIQTWDWNLGEGANVSTPGGLSHTYATRGLYHVTLRVTDNSGASSVATFDIRVLNRLPTATISSPTSGAQAQSRSPINFASVGSNDPESGGALTYFWIFGDGEVGAGPSVTHAFPRAGTYTVILTVSDPDGGASSSTVSVVILNQAPVSIPAVNVTEAVATLTSVKFTAAGSSDIDGTIVAWLWDFGDGTSSALKVVDHVYGTSNPAGGPYTVRLTVTDNGGLKHNATMEVAVTNRAPVARIAHGSPVFAEISAVFRGTESSDEDGVIVSWVWDFGDSTAVQSGAEASHSYAAQGTFVVKLTVTDNRGGSTVVTENVMVAPKPIFDTGKPTQGTGEGPVSPGFDGVAGLAAIGAVAAIGLIARRRRA